MKAKNREQYIEAWQAHVVDLIHPYLDAERPMKAYEAMKADLYAVIERAADNLFPEDNDD